MTEKTRGLEDFNQKFSDFDEMLDNKRIELFGYFLQINKGISTFKPRDIDACFAISNLPKPSWTRVHLNRLSKSKPPKFIKEKEGYKLTRSTLESVKSLIGDEIPSAQVSQTLSDLSNKFPDLTEKAFLDEAIICFKARAHRATIVMVWVLTMDHLYQYVLSCKLEEFRVALSKQSDKKIQCLTISKRDDFTELKETKFIEILRSSKIITNDVRKILDQKLGIRNSAAHPSNITFSPMKTEEFVEDLITNVVLKYPIIK